MSPACGPSETEQEKSCLGCGGHTDAEYVWHDGLYQSYVCADHAREQLPDRGKDSLRRRKLENGGRDRVVSGYATPIGQSDEKLVWSDEIDKHDPGEGCTVLPREDTSDGN